MAKDISNSGEFLSADSSKKLQKTNLVDGKTFTIGAKKLKELIEKEGVEAITFQVVESDGQPTLLARTVDGGGEDTPDDDVIKPPCPPEC